MDTNLLGVLLRELERDFDLDLDREFLSLFGVCDRDWDRDRGVLDRERDAERDLDLQESKSF